ncbi:MAG: hypothetical protein V3S73_06535 [Gammaproteobacteria bacterium]
MGTPRRREFNEDEVLDAAMHLFWAKRYPGTSMQDIVHATGLQPEERKDSIGTMVLPIMRCYTPY